MDSSSNPPPGNFSEQAGPPPQFFAGACCRCTTTPSTAPPLAPTLEKPSDEILTLEAAIDSLDDDLRELSLDIHGHPEVGWKEFRTHDVLCDFMKARGFVVVRHAFGLPTAWQATFEHGTGGKTVGFNSEMDSLPGIGHACGHNLIAIAGVAAALAVAAALKKHDIPGKVILLGTPAEEVDGGKIPMLKAGAYKSMDCCLMLHPAPVNAVAPALAVSEYIIQYTGHTAHAALSPWEAINAQDAAVLAYTSISVLRQQLNPTHRVHGIITGNDAWVQNVIPGTSKIAFGARAPTMVELEKLKTRVEACFQAGALATGCTYTTSMGMCYFDLRNNEGLGEAYQDYMTSRFGVEFPHVDNIGGSTDFGNVSYEIPALHPAFAIPCGPGEANHTIGFTRASATPEAHTQTLNASKGISVTAWRILVDEAFAKSVKDEFERTRVVN